MGGNLFKLGRKPRLEYLEIERDVRAYLDVHAPGRYRVPRYYATKPDFGDLDVIVPNGLLQSQPDFLERLRADLGVTRFKSVGRVYSTVYRDFQVDYFRVPDEVLDSTYDFLSFNDLGNLIGRMCRRFNLKYGEEGLSYVYRREDGNYLRDLEVTKDFARVCGFLGLRFDAWQRGFDTLEEMFSWVIESPFFSVKPYLEGSSDPVMARAKVRPTVERFVAFLRERGIEKTFAFKDRSAYLLEVDTAFPEANVPAQIEAERRLEARALEFQRRFNGQLVMRLLPHLSGKALGEFIVAFKNRHADFETYVLETPEEALSAEILEFATQCDNSQQARS
jgi:hypothetical protein